tara:strand:+ start:1750 stop:2760 length:1011 start_codon:yes stop_codon:yes gene_type:complete
MKDLFGRIMIDVAGTSISKEDKHLIANKNIGGIIFFSRNFISLEQIQNLIIEIKSVKENILFAVDQEGGRVQRFTGEFSKLPSLQEIYKYSKENNDPDFCKEIAWLTSSELIAAGIDVNFAPVVDLNEGSSMIIGDRSFSSNSDDVIKFAENYIEGMHQAGMKATAKHFPGHGGVVEDSHMVLPEDKRSLEELMLSDIKPYLKLSEKIDAVMCAHVLFSSIDINIPSYSNFWLNKFLREQLKYKGIVFSDDLSMVGAGDYECKYRAQKSIEAGCDMILICNNRKDVIETVKHFDELGIDPVKKISTMKINNQINWDELIESEKVISIKNKLKQIWR